MICCCFTLFKFWRFIFLFRSSNISFLLNLANIFSTNIFKNQRLINTSINLYKIETKLFYLNIAQFSIINSSTDKFCVSCHHNLVLAEKHFHRASLAFDLNPLTNTFIKHTNQSRSTWASTTSQCQSCSSLESPNLNMGGIIDSDKIYICIDRLLKFLTICDNFLQIWHLVNTYY